MPSDITIRLPLKVDPAVGKRDGDKAFMIASCVPLRRCHHFTQIFCFHLFLVFSVEASVDALIIVLVMIYSLSLFVMLFLKSIPFSVLTMCETFPVLSFVIKFCAHDLFPQATLQGLCVRFPSQN